MSKNSKPFNVRTHLSQGLLSTSSGIYRDLAVTNSSKHFKDKHLVENFNDEEPRKTTPLKIELPSYKKHERNSFSDTETDKFLSSSMTYDIPIGVHDNEKTIVENTVKDFPLFKTGKSNELSFERWPNEKLIKSIESLELTENVNKNSENNLKKDAIADGSKKKKKFLPVQSRYKQLLEKKEDASSRTIDISAIYPQNIQTTNNYKKKNCVTSTPFLASSVCNQQYDGSILDQSKFKLDDTAILNQEIVKKISMVKQNKKDNVKGPIKVYKPVIELDQLTIDIYNARLLQITYLHLQAQRAFEKQEEKVKEQIFTIWAANRKLEKKVEELNLFLETQKLLLSVEQLLNSQISGLKPLSSKLSKLNKLASKFSEILEKNSHILPISGISKIKDDELVKAVDESKIYLEELYHMTKVEQPQIEKLSKTICALKNTLDSEIIEQHKSAALLSDCVSLLNHERSLQVQLIQC